MLRQHVKRNLQHLISFPTMRDSNPRPPSARVAARLSGEVMDLNEVCDYLRLSRSSVKRAIKAGTIPALKIGTQWPLSSLRYPCNVRSREKVIAIKARRSKGKQR
jgi:excisionase family DNA binding protein